MTGFTFIYLRHGRTEANNKGLCSGAQCTHPLTEQGRMQIAEAADILSREKIVPGMVFFSPSIRAAQSAEIILSHEKFIELPRHPMEGLRERHMGEWEGTPFDDIYPALQAGKIGAGGEAPSQFHTRVQRAFSDISASGIYRPLVVSHAFVWDALHEIHAAKAPYIANGELFEVTLQDAKLSARKIK